jgi:hypothetical protein
LLILLLVAGMRGPSNSEKLRVTERFRRFDFGHLQYQITYDDPETLTKPLMFSLEVNYRADTEAAEQVKSALAVLEVRERLVFKSAVLAGLRPGEIFALRRSRLSENTADIRERIYRGRLDTPKTQRSIRVVALATTVRQDTESWLATSPSVTEDWLFPSENIAFVCPRIRRLLEPVADSCRASGPVQLAISLVERVGPARREMVLICELDGMADGLPAGEEARRNRLVGVEAGCAGYVRIRVKESQHQPEGSGRIYLRQGRSPERRTMTSGFA